VQGDAFEASRAGRSAAAAELSAVRLDPSLTLASLLSRPRVRDRVLITLTRLNGHKVVVNAELIKLVEATPDTMLTLINGDHIVVTETVDDVVEKAVEYGRRIRAFVNG
jgi:flagellar protein FlbD